MGAHPLAGPDVDPESPWGLRARAFRPSPSIKKLTLPTEPPNPRNWRHPKIGWGLVLADNDAISPADKAAGADVPAPLKKLLVDRPGAPVLRYRRDSMNGYLRRYNSSGSAVTPSDLDVAATQAGIGPNEIPQYLLIYGSPRDIPWRAQYALNMSRCVGRLDLADQALERYVEHLIGDWAGATCDPLSPVVWSVNFGDADITSLMQQVIADRFWTTISAEAEFAHAVRLKDAAATAGALAQAGSQRPGLVLTTSHGMTGPEQLPGSEPESLGLPVDAAHALLTPAVFPDAAIPGGAIWYAHACCSAGSDAHSQCADLFPTGHTIGDTLRAVAGNAKDRIAPLPQRLLGADTPVRAFVGHVEPTFDWILKDPFNRQAVGNSLANALFNQLYVKGTPVGFAFSGIYKEAGSFLTRWKQAIDDVNKDKPGAAAVARYLMVAALDRQSMVLLGDPTVTLPLP
jgi:hypothetical protein